MTPQPPLARILTWNVERQGPSSTKGRELGERILAQSADLICLTEALVAACDTELAARSRPRSPRHG